MDKLKDTLKNDAARIRVTVSDELDARIRASLQSVEPEVPAKQKSSRKTLPFWLASGLTGITAALAIIVIANLERPELPVLVASNSTPSATTAIAQDSSVAPLLRAETAVLTAPLREELENLESDLEKAKRAVREDMGLSF